MSHFPTNPHDTIQRLRAELAAAKAEIERLNTTRHTLKKPCLNLTALRKIVWKMSDAMQQVTSFLGDFEHRINLSAVREELGCIGPI